MRFRRRGRWFRASLRRLSLPRLSLYVSCPVRLARRAHEVVRLTGLAWLSAALRSARLSGLARLS
jgi:hypothetical protein